MRRRLRELFDSKDALRDQGSEQIRQFVNNISIALLLGIIIAVFTNLRTGYNNTALVLMLADIALITVHFLNKKRKIKHPITVLVCVLLITTFGLIISKQGLHDIAITIFPAILIVSGLALSRRFYFATLLFIIAGLWFVGLAEINGLIKTELSVYTTIPYMFDLTIILILSSVAMQKFITYSRDNLEKLGKSNLTKDRFFSILAHDLRSPYHGMLGISDILVEEFDSLTKEELKDFIVKLNQSMKTQFNFLEELLEWGKLQRGVNEFVPSVINLQEIILQSVGRYTEIARNKNLILKTDANTKYEVFVDERLISTVIRNLLVNAIKFTPKGGTISVSLKSVKDDVVINVSDSGIGMSKEKISNLFKMDVNPTSRGTEGEIGTGLGLIICKEIIDKSKGELLIESQEGKGSSISVILPKLEKTRI